jgi:hypothetical protein
MAHVGERAVERAAERLVTVAPHGRVTSDLRGVAIGAELGRGSAAAPPRTVLGSVSLYF